METARSDERTRTIEVAKLLNLERPLIDHWLLICKDLGAFECNDVISSALLYFWQIIEMTLSITDMPQYDSH